MGVPTFPTPNTFSLVVLILNSAGTGLVSIIGTQPRPYVVDAILVVSTDTIIHHLDLTVVIGSGSIQCASASIAAGVGTGGVPSVDLLAVGMPASAPILPLGSNATLSANVEETVSSGKAIELTVLGHYP